jgi:hypothetical protein
MAPHNDLGHGRGNRLLVPEAAGAPKASQAPRSQACQMPLLLHHIVIDAHDLLGLARFWSEVLG